MLALHIGVDERIADSMVVAFRSAIKDGGFTEWSEPVNQGINDDAVHVVIDLPKFQDVFTVAQAYRLFLKPSCGAMRYIAAITSRDDYGEVYAVAYVDKNESNGKIEWTLI